MEKASGVNLEAKSRAGVPEAVHVVLSTPVTLLEPVVLARCLSILVFQQCEEGGFAGWVTAYPPYYFTQVSCPGEDTPASRTASTLDTLPSPPYRARYHSLSRLKDAYDMTSTVPGKCVYRFVVLRLPI